MEEKKKIVSVNGTKSISRNDDLLFETLQRKLDKQDSVLHWSYEKEGRVTEIKIHFTDEETALDISVDASSIKDLQSALETIDNYFVVKSQRS